MQILWIIEHLAGLTIFSPQCDQVLTINYSLPFLSTHFLLFLDRIFEDNADFFFTYTPITYKVSIYTKQLNAYDFA